MKIILGEEHVIVRGIRPEEQLWGPYQFPLPYRLEDRLVVSVHVHDDGISHWGKVNRWFESFDEGVTWQETDPAVAAQCGLKLPNGDRIYFPPESAIDLSSYQIPPISHLTPGYDFSAKAAEGTLPIQDGLSWWGPTLVRGYLSERLPPSLDKKEWTMMRIPAGQTGPVAEKARLDWPSLTRVVHSLDSGCAMKAIFPRGTPKLGPDGAIWISCFSGEGHVNPENGQYSPYYSAELFRSEDNGRSFQRRGHMEYPADGHRYPYASGGFSDSDFIFMDDGSILWFFRSNWCITTGFEWAPMYWARSRDGGFTWTEPEKFAPVGTLPRVVRLENGCVLICYARPGIFLRGCTDGTGSDWTEEVVVMTPDDRSHLANVVQSPPTFHDWDGACNNPELLPVGPSKALLFYSDFYYPDENGVARKTILCREIFAEP